MSGDGPWHHLHRYELGRVSRGGPYHLRRPERHGCRTTLPCHAPLATKLPQVPEGGPRTSSDIEYWHVSKGRWGQNRYGCTLRCQAPLQNYLFGYKRSPAPVPQHPVSKAGKTKIRKAHALDHIMGASTSAHQARQTKIKAIYAHHHILGMSTSAHVHADRTRPKQKHTPLPRSATSKPPQALVRVQRVARPCSQTPWVVPNFGYGSACGFRVWIGALHLS